MKTEEEIKNMSDNQMIEVYWRVKSLKVWRDALNRYQKLIQPKATTENTRINEELKKISRMNRGISEWVKEGKGDFDTVTVRLYASTYKWLSDILHKYHSALNQELTEKKKYQKVDGEFEGEEKMIEELREILQTPYFLHLPRQKILVEDLVVFQNTTPVKEVPQVQYIIQKMIGQNVVGGQVGQMTQNINVNLVQTMTQLFEEINKSDLDASQKSLAFANIQTIQTQFVGPTPDKSIVEKAFETLGKIVLLIQTPEVLSKAKTYLQAALTLVKAFHPQVVDGIQLDIA